MRWNNRTGRRGCSRVQSSWYACMLIRSRHYLSQHQRSLWGSRLKAKAANRNLLRGGVSRRPFRPFSSYPSLFSSLSPTRSGPSNLANGFGERRWLPSSGGGHLQPPHSLGSKYTKNCGRASTGRQRIFLVCSGPGNVSGCCKFSIFVKRKLKTEENLVVF